MRDYVRPGAVDAELKRRYNAEWTVEFRRLEEGEKTVFFWNASG